MKNLFHLLLLFSCLCSAQIEYKDISVLYIASGRIGDRFTVEFEAGKDSVLVYKTTERTGSAIRENKPKKKEVNSFKIGITAYESFISEVDNTFRLETKEDKEDCFHSNLLIIKFSRNGKAETLSLACIESDLNPWRLKLFKKFLKIINEKD